MSRLSERVHHARLHAQALCFLMAGVQRLALHGVSRFSSFGLRTSVLGPEIPQLLPRRGTTKGARRQQRRPRKNYGQIIADEACKPTLDVIMRARDRRWNWLGHIFRLEEHWVIRQVLMTCVRPTIHSLFGDVPGIGSRKAAEINTGREK